MIGYLISTLISFAVIWWLLQRIFPDVPVTIGPPPSAVTVYTPSITINVLVTRHDDEGVSPD